MSISNDLVKQFVQITKDNSPVKTESTVYGTAVEYNGQMYVQIDGSDLITPVETTTELKSGERVTVMIKDHNATVTGNLTNPAAGKNTVANIQGNLNDIGTQITEFEVVIADKVSTKDFEANNAAINNLLVGKADINELNAVSATVRNLEAENANIQTLIAEKANISDLTAYEATIEHLQASKADITELNAATADINDLNANLGKISTLIGGDANIDNVQSIILTADNTTIDNALIKNAMIDTISADKITSGTVNTNNVNIVSEDGGIVIAGSTQQFKDQNGKVRVQIGKDAQGNFTFCLFSQDGTGILLDETGIKAGAVPDGLIVNDMVADNANISGTKLDISSVITQINGSSTSINSSVIKFDDTGQSLLVAFNSLKETVSSIEELTINGDLAGVMEQVKTNTTKLEVVQGSIETLVANTTITKENGQVVQLKDDYSSTKQTVNEISTKIGTLETNYKKTLKSSSVQYYLSTSLTSLSGGSWQDTAPEWTQGKYMWQRMKYTYTDDSVTYGTASCVAGAKGDTGEQGPQGPQGMKGDTGNSGVGVSKITNYYLAINSATGVTNTMTGWTTTIQNVSSDKKYLWNYEKVDYTNNTSTKTDPCIIGTYGDTGATGKGIQLITEYYATSTTKESLPTSWSTTVPTLTATNKYLWNYEKITYTDNSNVDTPKVIIGVYGDKGDTGAQGPKGDKGDIGPQGVQGPAGENGKTYYTWIKYADSSTGSGMSNDPTGKTYIGFAYNKTTSTESNTASDYTWSLIKGEKGDTGVQGPAGSNGKTTYTWIKYSDNADGTGLYDTPKSTTKYIGIATNKTTATESTTKTDYTWSLFKGDTGPQGPQGSKGDTGSQGPKGDKGATGEKGQSLTSSTPQWYLSTSNTTQTGGSWQDTMPTVTSGKYMWTRFKNVWANPTATTYTTPVLEQIAESVKEVRSKQAEYKQTLDEVSSTLTQTTTTANAAKTQASTNKQTIDSMSTTLTSTTNTANDALNKATKSQQNLDEFKTTVSETYTTKTDFNNLSIGGRNLIRAKDVKNRNASSATFDKNTNTWTIVATAGSGDTFGCGLALNATGQNSICVPYGKTYVFSCEIKVPRNCTVNADINTYAKSGSSWAGNDNDTDRSSVTKSITTPNQWVKYWFKWSNTAAKNTDKVDLYDTSNFGVKMKSETSDMTYYVRNIQGEIGNIPTEWRPAPEDIATSDSVTSLATRVQTAEQTLTKDGITNIVGDYYATGSNVDAKLDNLVVGSTNLLPKTDYSKENSKSIYTASNGGTLSRKKYDFGNSLESDKFIRGDWVLYNTLDIASAISGNKEYSRTKWPNITLEPNTEYTLSMWMYKNSNCGRCYFSVYPMLADGSQGNIVCRSSDVTEYTGGFVKVVKTFNTGSSSTTFSVRFYNRYDTSKTTGNSNVYIYHPKLEKGNKATDWSPAPEDIKSQFNSVTKSISEIKQTADSVTTTVSNMKIGGTNLLLNTQFEGAVANGRSFPNWIITESCIIYTKYGQSGYNKMNTMYLGNENANSDGTKTGFMYHTLTSDRFQKNTEYTLSLDLEAENNVKGWQVDIRYYDANSKLLANQVIFDSSTHSAGHLVSTFTSKNIDANMVQFCIGHKGSNNGASGYLLIVGNLMLEKGNTPTQWQPSPQDMASKSIVTQTANEVKYQFQQAGGFPNLVANGSPTQTNDNNWWYWNATKYTGDNNYTELGFYSNNTSDNNCCIGTQRMVVSPGKTYSISFWAYCEPNVVDPHVVAKCSDSNNENYQYPSLCNLKLGNANDKKWYKYKINWTAPSGITRMQLCFHQKNHTQNTNYVTRIDQVMVIEGKDIFPTKWYPRFEEVESNTTSIDVNGVNVRHSSGARTNLNSSALNFYNSSGILYAQVDGGKYHFWNDSTYVGFLGHTSWVNTNERVLTINADYNQTVALTGKVNSSDTSYQVWVVASPLDKTISGSVFHQGVTLIKPHTGGIFKFYGSSAHTDTYPGMIYATTDGYLCVKGDNHVELAIQVGSTGYNGLVITEIGENPYKKLDIWGRLDMHWWEIYNTNIVNNVSATSAQTYALRTASTNEETYSDPTRKTITDIFSVQSPTEGDIRWSDRQTYFTSEVETGVYECYVEIPWWIAQNLENDYHVNITCTNGFYQYYVSERDPYYFIVRSDKDSMGFTFELCGKLLDNNTTANNGSVAGDQYLGHEIREDEEPLIVKDDGGSILENNIYTVTDN